MRKGQDEIIGNWSVSLSLTPCPSPSLALGCSVKRKGVLPEGQVGKGRTVGGAQSSHTLGSCSLQVPILETTGIFSELFLY